MPSHQSAKSSCRLLLFPGVVLEFVTLMILIPELLQPPYSSLASNSRRYSDNCSCRQPHAWGYCMRTRCNEREVQSLILGAKFGSDYNFAPTRLKLSATSDHRTIIGRGRDSFHIISKRQYILCASRCTCYSPSHRLVNYCAAHTTVLGNLATNLAPRTNHHHQPDIL